MNAITPPAMISERLQEILQMFDPRRPYVWSLRLSAADFREIERALQTADDSAEMCRLRVIYLAEWYKRCYNGTDVKTPPVEIDYQAAWEGAGIDSHFLYTNEGGARQYFWSALVLGGLPMSQIATTTDTRTLKALCRIYKGEDLDLEEAGGEIGRAQAFRESFLQRASVYEFLFKLLTERAEKIYDPADFTCGAISEGVKRIREAFDEVMREKFTPEWVWYIPPGGDYAERRLRLRLRPEETGGYHHYLRFERARMWKIPNLKQIFRLRIVAAFMLGGERVATSGTIVNFENSGQEDTGFQATGARDYGLLEQMPRDFDAIRLLAIDDEGREHEVQEIAMPGYMQLWADDEEPYLWTSRQSKNSDTAAVYDSRWTLVGEGNTPDVTFRIEGEPWCMKHIADHEAISDAAGRTVDFWNRGDAVMILTRLYADTLRLEDGKANYYFADSDRESETRPVVFSPEDITVIKRTLPDVEDGEAIDTEQECTVEFKTDSGRYQLWTEENSPDYGLATLRITARGKGYIFPVIYLPAFADGEPIRRELTAHQIIYRNPDGETKSIDVAFNPNEPLKDVTYPLTFTFGEDEVTLNVYIPGEARQLWLDRGYSRTLKSDEEFRLPYILKDRVEVRDLGRHGYREYHCSRLTHFLDSGEYFSINKWREDRNRPTKEIDHDAPGYITVVLGSLKDTGGSYVYADLSNKEASIEESAAYDRPLSGKKSVLFQDMRQLDAIDCTIPKMNDGWGTYKYSARECFDLAIKYRTYFFIFQPIFKLHENAAGFREQIYNEIKDKPGMEPHLKRCAEELGLDWDTITSERRRR